MKAHEDDPDLGCRPVHAGLLALAEKMDADRARLAQELAPVIEKARADVQHGRHADAAVTYDGIGAAYRVAQLPGDAEYWERRARDCQEVARRRAKKGGTRK